LLFLFPIGGALANVIFIVLACAVLLMLIFYKAIPMPTLCENFKFF